MERTVLTFSVANILTVNLMVMLGAVLIGLVARTLKGRASA